jgi:HAMP domain-containing protein
MRTVGRYQLVEKIGEGAMAEVWRAYDPSIDRVLAIKILRAEFGKTEEYANRFLREAKAAGALAHPSIVTIYDVGVADGFPYIAMALLDGEPLDQVLAKQGKLSPDRVLAIAAQLASALSYAHLSGVVHRDVKPSNIMLSADGRSAKLLDFGIARVAEAHGVGEQVKTQFGQVLGTPRYMSPEQAMGRDLDGRSDLFSVGAVLYEAIVGKPAFPGGTATILALQITQQNPAPIATLEPECPGGLRFIVEKLLSKRPDRRFADGADLARALQRESKAYEAVQKDEAARSSYLPLQVRLTLAMVGVTAVALILSIGAVMNLQYRAMERMALSSGASIAAFVASNAALPAVENAASPPDQQDWTPIQAFIAAAAKDVTVRWMTMVDANGIIRGASDPKLLGTRYSAPPREALVYRNKDVTVTDIRLDDGRDGYRFVHPILYAGRTFGKIEVSIRKDGLEAAAVTTRDLMLALGVTVLLVVAGVSFAMAKLLVQPVRRLKRAIRDAAMGDLDFRISHKRNDEFGELFDGFNLLADTVQERVEAAERPFGRPRPLDQTRISAQPAAPTPAREVDAGGTPFDAAWSRRTA